MARKRPRTEPPPRWSEPLLAPRSRPEIPGTGDAFRGVARPIERADAAEMRAAKPTTRTTTPKRFHLSSVRELHTGVGSAQDAGASVNYTRAPAWIQFEPDGDAVVAVAGGCPVARWDVRGNTVDVAALARDARAESSSSPDASPSSLLVSIREDTQWKKQGHAISGNSGTTLVSRALVLGFHSARDAREARATLSSAANEDFDTLADGQTRRRHDDDAPPKSTARAEDDLFTRKIDIGSAERYFSYYASLAEQQNMLQDRVRTGTYFTAILEHRAAFEGAIVMDVGAGSGVLSCFAALAGARRVYAVEASDMADHCARIVASDERLRDVVKVIKGRVESDATRREILADLNARIPNPKSDSRVFDVLVSEPMGTMLLNERMIESFLIARDVFLKPRGGAMFPRAARMHCAPYEDAALRDEIENKAAFWTCASSKDFYGIDVSVLGDAARKAVFAQPVVDAFDPAILLAPPATFEFDFSRKKNLTSEETSEETSETPRRDSGAFALAADHLESLRLEADFVLHRGGAVHGVAWWFDVEFDVRLPGGEPGPHRRFLTTAPGAPTTHWFQIRAPIRDARGVLERVEKNTRLSVATTMDAGSDQSYAVTSRLEVSKSSTPGVLKSSTPGARREPNAALGSWNLKDPYYRQLHWPQPGYTEAQTKRWYGDEAAEVDPHLDWSPVSYSPSYSPL